METANPFVQNGSIFKVPFRSCPVGESLGTLGKKWALIILRNIAIYKVQRFNDIMRFTPGLNRRTLSIRLNELRKEGLIKVVEKGVNYSKWDLTEKGEDVLPILMTILNYGIKWHADKVFADGKARTLQEVFDPRYVTGILYAMAGKSEESITDPE